MLHSGERLTGTEVTVCDEFELNCHKCGATTAVAAGDWALVKCAAGSKGTIVKFVTPKNYFQACEVEVYGESTQKGSESSLTLPTYSVYYVYKNMFIYLRF